jgi:hypothetical protein
LRTSIFFLHVSKLTDAYSIINHALDGGQVDHRWGASASGQPRGLGPAGSLASKSVSTAFSSTVGVGVGSASRWRWFHASVESHREHGESRYDNSGTALTGIGKGMIFYPWMGPVPDPSQGRYRYRYFSSPAGSSSGTRN